MGHRHIPAALVILLALFPGVSSSAAKPNVDVGALQQQIKERAQARWAALIKGNWRAAYEFEAPGYRKVTSFEKYRGQFSGTVQWHSAKVTKVTIESGGQAAKVLLILDYTAIDPLGRPLQTRSGLNERWVHSDGDWWFVHD